MSKDYGQHCPKCTREMQPTLCGDICVFCRETGPTDNKAPRELSESRQILSDYAQKCSTVDEGNLYFAATQFEQAYDKLQARLEKCEGLLRNCKEPALDAGYGLTYKHILEYFAEVGSE